MSNQVAAQLIAALAENSRELAKKRLVERANLRQWWTDGHLRDRYSVTNPQLRALLEQHRIHYLPHGRGFRVHIDDVLRLDEKLKAERAA